MIHGIFAVPLILLIIISVSHGQLPPSVCVFFKTADCTTFKPRPICASDGTNFHNECEFSKAHCNDPSLHVIYDGKECFMTYTPSPLPVTTTSSQSLTTLAAVDLSCNITNLLNCNDFAPRLMCGSNGQTYRTDCDFAKAHCKDTSLTVITFGQECPSTTFSTTSILDTTSGTTLTSSKTTTTQTTSVTTTNKVTTQTATTKATTTKTVIPTTPKSSFDIVCRLLMSAECMDYLNVVCTTHGNYRNTCEYQKAKCLNPNIHDIHDGFCSPGEGFPDNPSVNEIACQAVLKVTCPNEGPPMCDNHGQKYANFCELEQAKCRIHGIKLAACPS